MKDVDRATWGTSRVFNTGTRASPSTSGFESEVSTHNPAIRTFCAGPCSGNFVEEGFARDSPLAATLAANVLGKHGEGIALEREIVFLGEDAEGEGAEVRELDLDGEKGRGGLLAGRVLAGGLSVEDGRGLGLEGVRGRDVVVRRSGRDVARALEDGRDGRHGGGRRQCPVLPSTMFSRSSSPAVVRC